MAEKTKVEKLSEVTKAPSTSKVDYSKLEMMLESGEELFAIKNTSNEPFVQDWNLELLPKDLEAEFDKYLEKKYLEYGQESLIGGPRIVSIFQEGRTINFLNSFLTGKKFPIILPRASGKEETFRSSFVLNSDDTVIMTATQKVSLARFEKIKRIWEEADKKIESPWLGFLVFTPIQDSKDLLKYNMSYVTSGDVNNSSKEIGTVRTKEQKAEAGIIRATE